MLFYIEARLGVPLLYYLAVFKILNVSIRLSIFQMGDSFMSSFTMPLMFRGGEALGHSAHHVGIDYGGDGNIR